MEAPNALTLNDKLDFIINQLRAMRKELQSLDIEADDTPWDHEPNQYESQRDKMREAGHKESDF